MPVAHKQEWTNRPRAALEAFPLLLAPYAPHLAEELWTVRLGHTESLTYAPWPTLDESLLVLDTINLPIQVRKWGKRGADKEGGRAGELWVVCLGHKQSLTYAPWPAHDELLLVLDTISLPLVLRQMSSRMGSSLSQVSGAR